MADYHYDMRQDAEEYILPRSLQEPEDIGTTPYAPEDLYCGGAPPTTEDVTSAVGHYAEDGPVRAPVKDGWGWSPTNTDGSSAGPYAQLYENGDMLGAGFGMSDGSQGNGVNAQVFSGNGRVGVWKDDRGGVVNGGEASGQVMKINQAPGGDMGPLGFEVGALTANAGVTIGENETSVGAGANVAEGAVTVGSADNNARVGVALGLGAAGRLHHSFNPETNKRSYGLGFDAGPFSVDARTDHFSDESLSPTPEAAPPSTSDDDVYRPSMMAYRTAAP